MSFYLAELNKTNKRIKLKGINKNRRLINKHGAINKWLKELNRINNRYNTWLNSNKRKR